MADAVFSVAVERIVALIEEQAKYHINLVKGAKKEVLSLGKELKNVRYKLNDAEKQSFEKEEISSWLWELRQTFVAALIKLQKGELLPDDVVAAPPKQKVFSFIPSSSCLCFKKVAIRHEIAKKVLDVKAKLDKILEEESKYGFKTCEPTAAPSPWRDQSTSFIDSAKVHGRGRDEEILVSKLLGIEGSHEESGVVSIVGVGGLGKTTLAQLAYNNTQVEECFDLRIWVCVSDPFDLFAIGKGILEKIEKGSFQGVDQLEVLFTRVKEFILGKKFLLVLDDVWTEDYEKWEHLEHLLKCGGVGSKILVTTRSIRVAVTTSTKDRDTFVLGVLSDDECWSILCHIACSEDNKAEFEEIGKKIAKKCSGLPLAAMTLGGVLRFKRSLREWENVLNSEIWEMSEAKNKLFRPLIMSYEELSQTQKQCFSYCAFFPKDFEINVESLIRNWMALGYLGLNSGDMELKGRECFNVLAHRSLFQDFEKNDLDEIDSCKMHDIVHDFAQYLRKSGKVGATEMNKSIPCQVCDPSQISNVNEFCTLYWDWKSPPNLCNCFVRSRVLCLARCGMKSVPQEMENLIHLRCLDLSGNHFSTTGLKYILQLYYLQTLNLCNCNLEEIPKEIENLSDLRHLNLSHNKLKVLPIEIGNLVQLTHLNLSCNNSLKELPNEIGNLIQMRHLDLSKMSLKELPESIQSLQKLEILDVFNCTSLLRLPKGLAQLTGLRSLGVVLKLRGLRQFRLLKNLNHLSGDLKVCNTNLEGTVKDAREAELRNKINIGRLSFYFESGRDESSSSREDMDVMDALEPHPNLKKLEIQNFMGSKFPLWMVSPLNQLKSLKIGNCCGLTSLPSFGKLPCLEEFRADELKALQYVGREFLGITTPQGGKWGESSSNIAFPKLKTLEIHSCSAWKEWEDITEEEEGSTTIQIMPCLKELLILNCKALTALPLRLLRKASSLESWDLSYSNKALPYQVYDELPGFDGIFATSPHLESP